MGFGTLVLVAAIALLVLLPTRRLYLAGWSEGALAAYFLALIAFGLLVAELRGPARYLVPILVVAYVAPFVTFRAGVARIVGRPPSPVVRPGPIRRVGPSDQGSADAEEPTEPTARTSGPRRADRS